MSLTMDNRVPQNAGMNGTELAYVRQKLAPCSPEEQIALAKVVRCHPKTIRRLKNRSTKHPRSDIVGKLAMHFRKLEERPA